MRIRSLHLHGLSAITLTLAVAIYTRSVRADSPIVADEINRIESRNKKFLALPTKDGKETVVYDRSEKKQREIWRMPGWDDFGHLSDDGDYLVYSDPHGGLINLNYKPSLTMLTFYKRGTLIRKVPLSELIRDFRSLRRTMSHYLWGDFLGFSALHRYDLHTVEGRLISFDVTTGLPVSNEPHPWH